MASQSSSSDAHPTEEVDSSEGTRERILSATRAILAEGGAERLSLERVAERAGVSRGTIYYQFGSRAGVIDEVIRSMEVEHRVSATREEDHTFSDVLERVTGIWKAHGHVLRGIFGMSGSDPETREIIHSHQAGRRKRMAELVDEYEQAGQLRVDASDAVDLLWLLTSFQAYDFLRDRAGQDHERAHALLELLAAGVLSD